MTSTPSNEADELKTAVANALEDILGQNYVDEYSGSNDLMTVEEIADKLIPLLEAHIEEQKLAYANTQANQVLDEAMARASPNPTTPAAEPEMVEVSVLQSLKRGKQ